MDEYTTRRQKLAASMQNNSAAILWAAKHLYRTASSHFAFRQNNDFYYLTGFPEADAVMVLHKDHKGNVTYNLFNTVNDPIMEIWDGKKIGQDNACKLYHADNAIDVSTINTELPKLIAGCKIIYYPIAQNKDIDLQVMQWLGSAKKHGYTKDSKGASNPVLEDLLPLIHELRVIKSPAEIAKMKQAAEISAKAHYQLMQQIRPGLMEYQLEAIFNQYCLYNGCRGSAYNAIVAGGNNACTLHYVANDKILCDGELVLVDAGGEYENYAADITRTFPVNGKFSTAQRQIYEIVLEAQLAGIAVIKPGNTFEMIQQAILEVMVKGLISLNILQGSVQQLIADGAYKKFYMHSSGHWLGLDVHDPGLYKIDNQTRRLEPGMVLTVEPGIYISNTLTDVERKWLGIGVRIEDDVLVTKNGNEVLSCAAPKTVAEIESARI